MPEKKFDISFEGLEMSPEQERLQELYGQLFQARYEKDKIKIRQIKKEIKQLKKNAGERQQWEKTVRVVPKRQKPGVK